MDWIDKVMLCPETTLDKKELDYLSKTINPTKKTKKIHYSPVLRE